MTTPIYQTTCTEVTQLTSDVYQVRFQKPAGLSFQPGQYMLFQVPLIENDSDIQPRAMSIASTMAEPDLLFAIKVIPGGRMSRYLLEKLKPGSPFHMQGPFGRFVLKDSHEHHLLIATSTGLAPFRAHVQSLIENFDARPVDLLLGVRSEADMFWFNELKEFEQKNKNFHVHVTLSQPAASWTGHKGRVLDVFSNIFSDVSQSVIYACGNPQMTLDLKKIAVEKWNVPKEKVHVEGYI